MLKLNKDVLFLISENLQDDSISLYSCLLVNKIWCEATVSILWKIPGRTLLTEKAERILFNVILSHLSEDSINHLKNQGINLIKKISQRPLFNYISLWRYLNLQLLENMMIKLEDIKESEISIIRDELLKLFINKNTRFV